MSIVNLPKSENQYCQNNLPQFNITANTRSRRHFEENELIRKYENLKESLCKYYFTYYFRFYIKVILVMINNLLKVLRNLTIMHYETVDQTFSSLAGADSLHIGWL